ncbi:MAG: hypothetical protein Q9N68_10595, partial [Gammaproteobacteria bacterium]|nr:hypothetical protein [Gammaproteobacteria bacterium]
QSTARAIISRSYYAALLCSSRTLGVATSAGHSIVINDLKKRNCRVGNNLHALKMLRQKADYDDNIIVRKDINKALRDSSSILTFLKVSFIRNGDGGFDGFS